MKDFLFKYIPSYILPDIKKISSPEWIFLLLVVFALLRLFHLQVFSHNEYEKLFMLSSSEYVDIGEIQDKDGNSLARKSTAIDLFINNGSTVRGRKSLSALDDPREFPACADPKNGETVLKKTFFGKEYSYKPDCGIFKEEKIKRNKEFQSFFLEKNAELQESCTKKKDEDDLKCPKIKFKDYLKYQRQLEEIYEVYNLSGFKFRPKQNGILDRIYRNRQYYNRYLADAEQKTVSRFNVGTNEMLALVAINKNNKPKKLQKEIEKEIIEEKPALRDKANKLNNKNFFSRLFVSSGDETLKKDLNQEVNKEIKKRFEDDFSGMLLAEYCSANEEKGNAYSKVNGVLQKECSYLSKIKEFQGKISDIKFGELKLKTSAKGKMLTEVFNVNLSYHDKKEIDRHWKEIENKKLDDFFNNYKEDNSWILQINKKELYERNAFTHYSLSQIFKTDKDKQIRDKRLMDKKYCAGSYRDTSRIGHDDCQELYKYNLDRIRKFINENKSLFPDYIKIKNVIDDLDKLKEDSDVVDLAVIPESNAYKMLPNVKNFSGYHTAGINFYKYGSFVNMLGSASIEKDSKIKESTRDLKRILSGLNVNYEDVIKKKSAFAEYMLAPMLGLDLNVGMNIMDVIKTGTSVKNWYGIAAKYHNELKENKNIVLTIDSFMQSMAELELKKKSEELKADRGIAIIQDVRNGAIIAAAEYSSPYSFSTYIAENRKKEKCDIPKNECKYSSTYTEYEQWKNAGFTSNMLYRTYKPGSTFKPFAVAIAIEKDIFSQKEIDGDVKFNLQEIYNFFLNPADKMLKKKYAHLLDSEDKDIMAAWTEIREHGNGKPDTGMFSLEKIIAKSSNVGTALAAYRLWQSEGSKISFKWEDFALFREAVKFGFGSRTGLGDNSGHPGNKESEGHLFFGQQYREKPEDRKLIIQEYLKSSYGQGIMDVTPIQLITAYSALVNGGTLHKPHIVKSVDGIEQEYESKSGIISPETSAIIRRYMKAVMDYGTGSGSRPEKAAMGGKTGTADIPMITSERKGKNGKERRLDSIKGKANLSSFAGFIPYEKPEYMILVMIDENRNMASLGKKYHPQGADAAAPVVKKLADAIYEKYMGEGK